MILSCTHCKKEFSRKRQRYKRPFCSDICKYTYFHQERYVSSTTKKEWYQNNKNSESIRNIKSIKLMRFCLFQYKLERECIICGENHPACLDFHHVNPENKIESINYMVRHEYTWGEVLDEIAKCQLLCANCHRKHHAEVRVARLELANLRL